MKKRIFLDFETRSKIDIRKSGAFKYASHESTEILCACWKIEDGAKFTWSPFLIATDCITQLFDLLDTDEYVLEAHNATFEWAMWNYCAVKKYNFPRLPFSNMMCTAARAAAMSLPRDLDGLAKALGLPIKKDLTGRRVMLKMCKPKADGTWNEDDADFDILTEYCMTDVLVTEQVHKRLPELNADEQKIFHLDFKINRKGVLLDVPLINTAAAFAEKYSDSLNSELATLTGGAVTSATQSMKLVMFLQENGIDVDSVDKQNVLDALKVTEDATLRRVLEIRQALALSSTKKLYSMLAMAMRDSRARGTLLYAGANRTGRWSGKGIQIQNLPRGSLSREEVDEAFILLAKGSYEVFKKRFPDVLGAISSCIRGFIIPPKGKRLLAGDFSAIEARVIFWLAGHEKGLNLYRQGKDLYKDMASFVFNVSYDKVTKHQRQLGKAIILGCSYGMGHSKFKDTAAKAPYFIDLTTDEAKGAVEAYRSKHAAVKAFWYALDDACKNAIKKPGSVHKVGKVSISLRDKYLFIKLPSGRKLAYYKPIIQMVEKDWGTVEQVSFFGVDQETKKWGLISSYGGKWAENCFSADTKILTNNGLKKIVDVEGTDLIFDGHDFVKHGGVICKGMKEIVKWNGASVTPDHRMQVNSSLWKSVAELGTENMKTECLRWGRYLAQLWLHACYQPERKGTPNLSADAVCVLESLAGHCGEGDSLDAASADHHNSATHNFRVQKASPCGRVGTQESCADAQKRNAERITTTEGVGSPCTQLGALTDALFTTISRLLTIGTKTDSTLTGLIMKNGTSRETCASLAGSKIVGIAGLIQGLFSRVKSTHIRNLLSPSYNYGNLQTLFTTIITGAGLLKKSKESMMVYDVVNCGPRHKFAVVTDKGLFIAHNCTQAVARDLMAFSMLQLDEAGYESTMLVHDEIVSETVDGTIEEYTKLMELTPHWALGMPLGAEVEEMKRYRK